MEGEKKTKPAFSQWCSVTGEGATCTNGNNLEQKKKKIIVRVVRHWKRLLRVIVWSPHWKIILQTQLNTALGNMLELSLHWDPHCPPLSTSLALFQTTSTTERKRKERENKKNKFLKVSS